MPHAAFYVVQLVHLMENLHPLSVSMPHAAFYVVQQMFFSSLAVILNCFNAARGFLCGATNPSSSFITRSLVSMPHAAFYVVQQNDTGAPPTP